MDLHDCLFYQILLNNILQQLIDFACTDWLRAMVYKSTDHGKGMMVMHFCHFSLYLPLQDFPRNFNGNRRPKLSMLL